MLPLVPATGADRGLPEKAPPLLQGQGEAGPEQCRGAECAAALGLPRELAWGHWEARVSPPARAVQR